MEDTRRYGFAFDLGIGSVGWAVVSIKGEGARIEDFGSRIFTSGETNNGKDRASQERRAFRGVRRVLRRRFSRKEELKRYVKYLHFLSDKDIQIVGETPEAKMAELKCRALDEKISRADLLRLMIHTCNHRGYRSFYEVEETAGEAETEDEKEEAGNQAAADRLDAAFRASGCRTISEYLVKHGERDEAGRISFRNRFYKEDNRLIIRREHMQDELEQILRAQQAYDPALTDDAAKHMVKIIFSQRDFEDGPGDPKDPRRKYKGFLDSIGYCRFYPEEKRGFRKTVLGDVYAAVNALSQYRYIQEETGEIGLTAEAGEALIEHVLYAGEIGIKSAQTVLKPLRIQILKSGNMDGKTLNQSVQYIKIVKQEAERAGLSWERLLDENQLVRTPLSFLNALGELLCSYQTPSRRKQEIKKLKDHGAALGIKADSPFWTNILKRNISGTANVSYHHMEDAIEAFQKGDIYGNFQWGKEEKRLADKEEKRRLKLPAAVLLQDEDLKDNPVVYRTINETRKILNALIDIYGSPYYINVEVADDVARSFLERARIARAQKANEKDREQIREKIAELLGCAPEEVKGSQIEKYKLYREQDGKSLYSGKDLGDLTDILREGSHRCEVDHIVPYSLILDNTLHNKALVLYSENQEKGQRTPLMYLVGEAREEFKKRIAILYKRKVHGISAKKYQYLSLETLYGEEAKELLTGWKSRNINDTRYITKYVTTLLKENLRFSGDKPRVYGIRGSITSRYRRQWLAPDTWGSEVKNRDTYLNHAADAVVIANLTPAVVEIAMVHDKLRQVYNHFGKRVTGLYEKMRDGAAARIARIYHLDEELVKAQLENRKRSPSLIPDLWKEVNIRFNDTDEALLQEQAAQYYAGQDPFLVPIHMPLVSIKEERKFRGSVADSQPVRLIEVEGQKVKVLRKRIEEVKAKDIRPTNKNPDCYGLYSTDGDLWDTLKRIFAGKKDTYTVEEYMKEEKLSLFRTDGGQIVRKVSIKMGPYTNYYRKNIGNGNYSYLGMTKYYCVEVYKDSEGKVHIWGIRFVDMVQKDGKLYIKDEAIPSDYAVHETYLFSGDYIEMVKKGKVVYQGFVQNVYNINQGKLSGKRRNESEAKPHISISGMTVIKKYRIDLLGQISGEVNEKREEACFARLSSRTEKK